MALAACGEKIVTMSGYGATESGPATTFWTPFIRAEGGVGLPLPGCDLKFVPHDEKLEVRVKGPNVTPGYWRDVDATSQAFDDEGFFRLGDALRFGEPQRPKLGFVFDGRINEDFKLATGIWVSTGAYARGLSCRFRPLCQRCGYRRRRCSLCRGARVPGFRGMQGSRHRRGDNASGDRCTPGGPGQISGSAGWFRRSCQKLITTDRAPPAARDAAFGRSRRMDREGRDQPKSRARQPGGYGNSPSVCHTAGRGYCGGKLSHFTAKT